MTEIYRFIFECLTDKFTLPLPRIAEAVVMFVIGEITYHFAFKKVGELYRAGIISGRRAGSILHWVIRFGCYGAACIFVRIIIAYYNFFAVYGLLILPLTIVFALIVYAVDSLQKELNSNA